MAVAYSAFTQLGMLSQQYPPPLLPKPRKDNVKLQKLLKRSGRKKASTPVSQSAIHFRTSLSPVSEASPDLEHSDHSTPPKTPETPFSLFSARQPPRFTVRPLYQHVASPYPHRAARFSFPTVPTPSPSYLEHLTTRSPYTTPTLSGVPPKQGPVAQLASPKTSLSDSTEPAPKEKKSFVVPFLETHNDLKTAIEATRQPKHTIPGSSPYTATGGQSLIRPLTVLTPFVKPKSPRPTFKATDRSKSPKPMFDVPQIKMYTASTSYYEMNKTPPVYDSVGLTAIGSTVTQSKTATEEKEDFNLSLLGSDGQRRTSTSETRRGTTPTAEINKVITKASKVQRDTSATELKRVTTTEIRRVTPTAEIRRVTPTAEIRRVTPTAEIRRVTPTAEIRRVTPTAEIRRVTPTAEIRRVTPTAEIRQVTPMAEIRRVTPTAEIRAKTPTAEIRRVTPTAEIRAKTPTAEIRRVTPTAEIRAKTPTAEIRRVTPTAEIRAKTPTAEIRRVTPTAEIRAKTPTAEIRRVTPTAEIQAKTPTAEIRAKTPTAEIRAKTPTYENQTLRRTGRPKTPSQHLTRTVTPVFEISRPNPLLFAVSPITILQQRSRTPKTPEPKPTETIVNGDIHSDMTPVAKADQPSVIISEPDQTREIPTTAAEPQAPPKTPADSTALQVTSHGFQRPMTPTYEASRLRATSPGYRRPKTPTYGTSPPQVSAAALQRLKTQTQVSQKPKSGYRGLTPAEYAAYGGFKSYSPAFGFSSTKAQTDNEIKAPKDESKENETPGQGSSVKTHSIDEVSKVRETPAVIVKPDLRDEKDGGIQSFPTIIVTQASSEAPLTQGVHAESSLVAAKQEKTEVKPPTVVEETQKKVEAPIEGVAKPPTGTPDTKHPLPKGDEQDTLGAVTKLFGKAKDQTTEQKAETGTKASISYKKVPTEPVGKDKESEPAPEREEPNEPLSGTKPPIKPKSMKSKMSGWFRLKKHMVVEQEEPKFPDTGSTEEAIKPAKGAATKAGEKAGEKPGSQDENRTKGSPQATKMWDAVLFQMFSTKENIMHQIELNKSEDQKESKKEKEEELKEVPSFAYRLPVLLFTPKFDAKKLREAASRPVTKISTVFEMGLIGRKGKDEEPKDFNRTAKGFTAN